MGWEYLILMYVAGKAKRAYPTGTLLRNRIKMNYTATEPKILHLRAHKSA